MNSKPTRTQLSRRKGWKMPENTVKVDRSTRWGNPYRVGVDGTAQECVDKFRSALIREGNTAQNLYATVHNVVLVEKMLRGKNLACWCKPGEPCHADVLLEIANR